MNLENNRNHKEGNLAKKLLHTAGSGAIGLVSFFPFAAGIAFSSCNMKSNMHDSNSLMVGAVVIGACSLAYGIPYLHRSISYVKEIFKGDYNIKESFKINH